MRFLILLVLIFTLLKTQTVNADIFTAKGIKIDEISDTVVNAKREGVLKAQNKALMLILSKITLGDSFQELEALNEITLSSMISSMEFVGEKSSEDRYIAQMTISFYPELIKSLLRENNIPFVQTKSRPTLIIPLLIHNEKAYLWEDYNLWKNAWSQFNSDNTLVPLIIPIGDLEDTVILKKEDVININLNSFYNLAEKYNVTQFTIVEANLIVYEADGKEILQVATREYNSEEILEKIFSISNEEDLEVSKFLDSGVKEIAANFNNEWKKKNMLISVDKKDINVQIQISSLSDLLEFQKVFNKVTIINYHYLSSLTTKQAEVLINFDGEMDKLKLALKQHNIQLVSLGDSWLLQKN